jgi:predicted nucleotidyltransferase
MIVNVVTERAILKLVDDIARRFHPERIILFGSYAWGEPTEDSDIDLMVVKRYTGPSYLAATRVRAAVDVDFPMDILVRSPAEVTRRLAMRDFFIMDIMEDGLVLHDADDRRLGEQGRRRLRRRLHATKVAKAQPV